MIFSIIFWIGVVFTVAAIALLGLMILKATKTLKLPQQEQHDSLQRLIPLNFAALGLAILGLMLIFIALKLG